MHLRNYNCKLALTLWHLLQAAKENETLHADFFATVQWLNPSITTILNNIQRATLRTKLHKSYECVSYETLVAYHLNKHTGLIMLHDSMLP